MEKIAGNISGLLEDTLDLYQELRHLLEAEKEYIVEMDVQKMWKVTDKKKTLANSLEMVIEKILGQAKQYASHLEMTVTSFQVREVVSALPLTMRVKAKLKNLGNKIDACKHEIFLLAHENKRYITESLSVIDGIFSTVVHPPGQEQYSQYGQIVSPKDRTCLINAEV